MMMRGEFGEASSPSRSPSTPLQTSWNHSHRHQNLFPGDSSSSSTRFYLRSPSDYSLSSYFSTGLCSSEDGSSQFASPTSHLGLCESFHSLNIGEEEEYDKSRRLRNLGNHEPSDAIGFRYGVGVSSPSQLPNQQLGWESYGRNGPEFYGWDSKPQVPYNPGYKSALIQPMVYSADEPFISDNSLIVDGKSYSAPSLDHGTLFDHHQGSNMPKISEIQGYVYLMAKDQHGCRLLQRMFDNGTALDAIIIFNEVIPHVVELMMDPFGNYLMQKLLECCTQEQTTQIILMLTAQPGQLIRISLNAYGTRVVQRLVESIKTRKQISMVKSAFRPGFLNLIRDLNGNHVIQRCLQCLSTEDNEFIFEDATKFCIDIATHPHGCCVLQKCVAYSTGQQREKLITEISTNSLFLAQDPYGNYAVQFVIQLRDFSAISTILAQLRGHYVELSMQKFSSHLVERCLTHCPESRPQIVRELISVPHFDHLIQDPYANFVIQAALAVTKSSLHATLVEVIRPHSILRNNPYCKRIFSRNLLKN